LTINKNPKTRVLENIPKSTQTQPGAWGTFMKLQNIQNLKNNQDQTQISQDSTQNLKDKSSQNYLKPINQNVDFFA
jgi:hypothetical protein